MPTQEFAIPSRCATKRLKIKTTGGRRKIAISSNLLRLFNFEHHDRVVERSLGAGKGISIERVHDLFSEPSKTKQVYARRYSKRSNNPLETLIEVQSQKLISESFPSECTHVHVEMRKDVIYVRPLTSFKAQALLNATPETRYSIFAACTSGVDLSMCCEPLGMSVNSVIEFRPVEKRDMKRKSDLTETGALTALRNIQHGIKNLFCEDVTTIDVNMLADAVAESPATIFMASPQCDDWSNVKAQSLKDKSIEDLSSTMDMALDMFRIATAIKAPVICFENVGGWYKSPVYQCLSLRLRKLGYTENLCVSDAREHGGLTSRVRGYAVFSCLDAPFEFEPSTPHRDVPIWPIVEKHLADCRDVTDNLSMQAGLETGRLRTITPEKCFSPTILKSQQRSAKDSLVLELDGRLYWPSEGLLKELMGMSDLKLDCVSKDIGGEIIGQSVDVPALKSVLRSVISHIDAFFEASSVRVPNA